MGTLVYLANLEGGLAIVNAPNPSAPAPVSSLMSWFEGKQISTQGTVAFVSGTEYWDGGRSNLSTLKIFNMANPAQPVEIGKIGSSSLSFLGFAISGNYAYVACGSAGMTVIDISNPALPRIVGSYDTPGWAYGVAVEGNYAYVADGAGGLRILNISNPSVPVSVGSVALLGSTRDVTVAGNYAYTANSSSIQIVNISNKTAPVGVGQYAFASPSLGMQIKVQGTVAYTALSTGGLITLDVSNPAAPRHLSTPACRSRAHDHPPAAAHSQASQVPELFRDHAPARDGCGGRSHGSRPGRAVFRSAAG
jgi:hypothetical protein